MNTDTKKQHYVWRKYLEPWKLNSKEKRIWTYIIKTHKIGYVSLMDVAQESYFYKMYELSPDEILICRNLALQLPSYILPIADSLLKAYELISSDMMSEADKRVFALHAVDHMQTRIETMGSSLLNCKNMCDIKKIQDKYQMVFYVCVQYCRTNKMREAGIIGYKDDSFKRELYRKAFPLISILIATTIGCSLVVGNPNTRYIFVYNKTSTPFVTSDQPVINLKKDDVDNNGDIKDIELYYPLSPSTAIIISQNSKLDDYTEIIADESFVEDKNKIIFENASTFVFASNEAILSRMMKLYDSLPIGLQSR